MRKVFTTVMIALGATLLPAVAEANSPLACQTTLMLTLILPLMLLVTTLSGGYALMKKAKKKPKRWQYVLASALFIFLAIITESIAFLIITGFCLIVLVRGAFLVVSAIKARRHADEPPWNEARPWRLLLGALVLFAAVGLLARMYGSFLGEHHRMTNELKAYHDLETFLSCQFDYQRKNDGELFTDLQDCNGLMPLEHGGVTGLFSRIIDDHYQIDFQLAEDRRTFTIRVIPGEFASPPLTFMARHSSFYADQTGQIRKIEVTEPKPCPPDAPVVRTVQAPGS
ncbi:MAG TPA: DUF308 domain-containing protein [bacterium]|nr:DUF308 domain-containing protein [bacterium]